MARAFTSMTLSAATRLSAGLVRAGELGVLAVCLMGTWQLRRFVIVRLEPSPSPTNTAIHDLDACTLTIPIDSDAELIVKETRRFGARIEHRYRSQNHGFEPDVSTHDRQAHIVHRYHHVALCGHRGPWSDAEKTPLEGASECDRCRIISVTEKPYRARYH